MPSNPADLRQLAQELSLSEEEISLRASISRSYYSAYHYSLGHVSNEKNKSSEWIGGEGGVHQKLITYLVKSKDIKEKSLGYILKDLRTKRVIADYFLNDTLYKEDAESALHILDNLINKLGINTE